MPWASTADVGEITGVTVTDDRLSLAAGVIEMVVGRTQDATWIPARDLRWLKRAVAYQAAWMESQPDYLTRSDVVQSAQDGASATYKGAQDLAPLAKRALKRLTWRGNRSVHTESTLTERGGPYRLGVDGVVSVFDYQWDHWTQER